MARQNTNFKVQEHIELMDFLREKMPENSRNSIKSLLTHKQVLVDDKVVSLYNHKLEPGQMVSIIKTKVRKNDLKGIVILYEDDDIVVVEKEKGILSVATDSKKKDITAYSILKDYVKASNPKNKIFIVHRLDRDTSGIMIFAKNPSSQDYLQKNWNDVVKERTYVAVVQGRVIKDKDTIVSYLAENKAFITYSTEDEKNGKKAITTYKVLNRNKNYSLLKVDIETGRKNQIRVHMKEMGHSVIGDKKYGGTKNPIQRLGLHAHSIVFKHPKTNKILSFKSDIPKEFLSLFK